jgi:hypothetical protein
MIMCSYIALEGLFEELRFEPGALLSGSLVSCLEIGETRELK